MEIPVIEKPKKKKKLKFEDLNTPKVIWKPPLIWTIPKSAVKWYYEKKEKQKVDQENLKFEMMRIKEAKRQKAIHDV